jgi:hypothetical protein
MRLLNTITHEMKEFVVDIPHYAILSHTWNEEEVTYYDIANRAELARVSKKRGYKKLMGFCEEAARQGFKWVWIDACCIDKTSSAELSEAINSMFFWYRDAVVCYVYLVDFIASSDPEFAVSGGRSRWFTRGWTLQELLAPENVVFYDHNWKDCGTKQSLAGIIANITKIDQRLLSGEARMNEYSVAQKMSWASLRETTRVEDMAYSLLGIFEINMPLLYGEGLKSFTRLQEEIIKSTTDQTVFAWRMRLDTGSEQNFSRGILASSPADFRNSGRIVQAGSRIPQSSSNYEITNRGLMIDMPVQQDQDKLLGVLDCHLVDHPNTRLALFLRESSFAAQRISSSDIAVTNLETSISSMPLLCSRALPDTLRSIQLNTVLKLKIVPLVINPLWISPSASVSKYPLIDISVKHDLGSSGYSLIQSTSLNSQDTSRGLMTYTFRNDPENMFSVKVQWAETEGKVSARTEIKISDEAALEDWSTELIDAPSTEAGKWLGGEKDQFVRARIRHRLKENRRGQILSLVLIVSAEEKTQTVLKCA